MIYFLMFTALTLAASGCAGGSEPAPWTDERPNDSAASASPDTTCTQRFEDFPDRADSFVDLYGYDDSSDSVRYGPRYDSSYQDITTFFHLSCVGKSSIVSRAIDISIGLEWQADGVNHFQSNVISFINMHPDIFSSVYTSRQQAEREVFLDFLLSGPVNTDKVKADLVEALPCCPDVANEIKLFQVQND